MKLLKSVSILFLLIVIPGCSQKDCVDIKLSDDFLNDLASEDNKLASELYLDYFNSNLDTLTYSYYINYLSNHEAPSAEGLTETIQCADEKYLLAESSYFIIVLHYKDKRTFIGDDSRTQISVDSIYTYSPEGAVPSVEYFAKKMKQSD
jgi:hypothetical protein